MSLDELILFEHLVSSANRNGIEWATDKGKS